MPLALTGLQILDVIKSFKKRKAPGPFRLKAEHLKVMVKFGEHARGDKALDAV